MQFIWLLTLVRFNVDMQTLVGHGCTVAPATSSRELNVSALSQSLQGTCPIQSGAHNLRVIAELARSGRPRAIAWFVADWPPMSLARMRSVVLDCR